MAEFHGASALDHAAQLVGRQVGDIAAAPLAGNMLLDHDAQAWATLIRVLHAEVGDCPATEPVRPGSAMQGRFTWAWSHGRVDGPVQRATTRAVTLQALEFTAAMP